MNVAELSTVVVWGATTAYALAFGAFAVDLARRAEVSTARRTDHETPRAEPARRALAGVPAGSVADPSGGASSTTRPVDDDGPRAVDDEAQPEALGTDEPAPEYRPGRALGIAMSVMTLGLLLEAVGIVLRGVAAHRVPWANMYEFTVVGTFVAVLTFRLLTLRRDVRFLGTLVLGLSVVALGLGLTAFYTPAGGVEPALQSYWLVIHVTIAVIASGMFTVGVSASALQLAKAAWENGSPLLAHRRFNVLGQLPSVRALEGLAFRINAVGFVLWTFTVMAGAVWAEHAWSRFWGWDPKEVWSFIVWVVYAAYLHARTTRGWSPKAIAWFSIAGFAVLIFNFTAVNLLMHGKHSYSGLDLGK
ncbi:c-type cytochrome biogenesis protein CcsB [Isoptericola sp. b441]|uniref:C-type cytochrome biogenesis protein CcsB n=1 Tax=Actinotalea lenta TaxID=3064654 RepID=A0ABT9D7G3_9CELL|nr:MULTISPECIES: c-type cytochrome biogenesis protein CcsB [unclassified Isoptericola]MDO8106495.1 c-type cytochrome biogenesis protein CcsB [Isoptericola sp. b441]MDO8121789.1 c-type cytochrome biogenesis protein CcsB [Isoptericola sp. b490]